jgi:hypothetical protein
MERVGMSAAPKTAVVSGGAASSSSAGMKSEKAAAQKQTVSSNVNLIHPAEPAETARQTSTMATAVHKASAKSRGPVQISSAAQIRASAENLNSGNAIDEAGVSAASQSEVVVNQSATPVQTKVQISTAPPDTGTPSGQNVGGAEGSLTTVTQAKEPSGLFQTSGNVSINGEFTKDRSLVYAENKVVTPGGNGALLTGNNNVVILSNNSQFTAQPNQFFLDSGRSDVNTSTGLAARVKDYTITPVLPQSETHYDINWADDGVYVYARKGDVDITAPCRSWRVKEGQGVKIRDPRRCAGIVWLDQAPKWPRYAFGGMAAAGTGVVIWIWTHQEMSPLQPSPSLP